LYDRIEIGRSNVSTHVESPGVRNPQRARQAARHLTRRDGRLTRSSRLSCPCVCAPGPMQSSVCAWTCMCHSARGRSVSCDRGCVLSTVEGGAAAEHRGIWCVRGALGCRGCCPRCLATSGPPALACVLHACEGLIGAPQPKLETTGQGTDAERIRFQRGGRKRRSLPLAILVDTCGVQPALGNRH